MLRALAPLRRPLALAAFLASPAIGACALDPLEPPQGHAQSSVCGSVPEPGASPIRRMTRFEYDNTIFDLLGDRSRLAASFTAEEEALGFDNQATSLGVSQLLAEQYMRASETLAEHAVEDLGRLLPCDPAKIGDDACATAFVQDFATRAYRRPVDAASTKSLLDLYVWGRTTYDFPTGIALVIERVLQSPRFLYRVETGMAEPVDGDVVALDDWEIASRLSYLLWGSMPDAELFAAATAGELRDPTQIRAHAERLLNDPRSRGAVANFHVQWLGISNIESITKEKTAFPAYGDHLPALWKRETEELMGHVVLDDNGTVGDLLTAPYSMMNAELAAFYGIMGPNTQAFEKVDLDPAERAGFLTNASVLATYAKPNRTSPVHRGKFVRERLLCTALPPPPPNIPAPPPIDPHSTYRQQLLEQHEHDPFCASCHVLMDPIGFGFEHYDGIGQWRDEENGLPVDATGKIVQSDDVDGDFDGAVELANKLAGSAEVKQCVAVEWFRFGYGRAEEKADACSLEELDDAFAKSGYTVKSLILALTQTDAFRYRHAVKPGR